MSHGDGVEINLLLLGHLLDRSHAGKQLGRSNLSDRAFRSFLLLTLSAFTTDVLSVVLLVSEEVLTAG